MKTAYRITLTLVFASVSLGQARADRESRKTAEVRRVMFAYATCVVKQSHTRASDAVLSNATGGVIIKRYPELINSACLGFAGGMGSQMTFSGDAFRYALADALVNADFSALNPTDFSNKLPLAPLPRETEAELVTELSKVSNKRKRAEVQESFDKGRGLAWASAFGECVARQNPSASRLWLLTKPDGPEEISRINVLRPAFATCLDHGTLSFGKFVLRGTVAINYYRLAMATPQPIPGNTH